MDSKAAAISLRGRSAYRNARGYDLTIEQIIRATWSVERIVSELEGLDREDDYRIPRGMNPRPEADGIRSACLDVLHAMGERYTPPALSL